MTRRLLFPFVPLAGAAIAALVFAFHVPLGYFALLALWVGLLVGVPFLKSDD